MEMQKQSAALHTACRNSWLMCAVSILRADISRDVTWTNWSPSHPKSGWRATFEGDCVRMKRSDRWRWHEAACFSPHRQYRFICQYGKCLTSRDV